VRVGVPMVCDLWNDRWSGRWEGRNPVRTIDTSGSFVVFIGLDVVVVFVVLERDGVIGVAAVLGRIPISFVTPVFAKSPIIAGSSNGLTDAIPPVVAGLVTAEVLAGANQS